MMSKKIILIRLQVETTDEQPAIDTVVRVEDLLLKVFTEEQIIEVKLERRP